jgi:hypothetical protein
MDYTKDPSTTKDLKAAKDYVDRQLDTMRRHGAAPDDFSEEEYNGLIEEIAEALDTNKASKSEDPKVPTLPSTR